MLRTYDRSPSLFLALVAHEDLSRAAYVPLDQAPPATGTTSAPYLQQLHAVANGVAEGLVVRARMPREPARWDVLSTV